mgnify:CR=1 FL=1
MRRPCLVSLAVFWAIGPYLGWPDEAAPLTLTEAYALALKRSETIAIQSELIKETEARFLQSLSGILPRASFALSEKRQDGTGGSAFTLKEVPERKFVFTQPLFSGFKEFAAMAGTRAERRQRVAEKSRAEHLLLVDVADAVHLLLQQRQDLSALETIRTALIERIDELQERERLGRSRPSEVVSAEAQLRRVEAEMELVKSQGVVSRHLLEFLTGLDAVSAVADPVVPLDDVSDEPFYLAKANGRPDVQAAEEAWRVAHHEVTIARAKFWPTVSAEGNYYTERVGSAADVDWDVTLTAEVPLFQGGQTVGAVKEKVSEARQAKLRFEQALRRATLEIADAYAELSAAIARRAALLKALDAAEQSYRLQTEDYRLNLVNNLDVLEALETLQDARRDAIGARHEAARRYWRLRAATGAPLDQ